MIEFNSDLMTGNPLIDTQHKELIDKVNAFSIACDNGKGKTEAVQMLSYLRDYTDFHFGAEEELQKKAEYPAYEEHKKKHEEFKKTVAELEEYLDDIEGPNDKLKELVRENVENWLVYHIGSFDKSVADFIFMNQLTDKL